MNRRQREPRAQGFFLSYLLVALPILLIINLVFYALFVPAYQREVETMNDDTVQNMRLTFDNFVTKPLDKLYLQMMLETGEADLSYPLRNEPYDDMWKIYQAHTYLRKQVSNMEGMLDAIGIHYERHGFINSSAGFFFAGQEHSCKG